MAKNIEKTITALKVRQWLPAWNEVNYDPKVHQAKPKEHFYLCSIKAGDLKALTGVYRRTSKGPRAKDPNVQRGHEAERSSTIRDYIQYGYPWCEMGEAKRSRPDADDLRKPGWLPTAILVNILPPGELRNQEAIAEDDLIQVVEKGATAELKLPKSFTGSDWQPKSVFPLEVIDGQHRLWAFEDFDLGDDFELPVVAFFGLDRGWQAYLFWSVNITPKKINRSLAFDLYPLLRQESWLDKFEGHSIYRETRSQELVEALWSYPESPWHLRINMLGERLQDRDYKGSMVSQAAWIRSLMATFVKQWEGSGTKTGGLFGAPPTTEQARPQWNRAMQAAFLINAAIAFKKSIAASKSKWAESLRHSDQQELFEGADAAFYGDHSLISTDQGIRGFLYAVNDLCFVQSDALGLSSWTWEEIDSKGKGQSVPATDYNSISTAIKSLSKKKEVKEFIEHLTDALATYDWRTSSFPKLNEEERLRQGVFRGSSGYKEMRRFLLGHLATKPGLVGKSAKQVLDTLKY